MSELAVPAPRPIRRRRADQEFLPAALELLETPPSPVRLALLLMICSLSATALLWSYLGRMDIFAVADGKIRPVGQIKTIQPLQTGRVQSIAVKNGRHVDAGETLIELDPSEIAADMSGTALNLASFQAEIARRYVAIAAARKPIDEPIPPIVWPAEIQDPIRFRETRVLESDLGAMRAAIRSFDAQTLSKAAERDRLIATTAVERTLVATLQERVNMRGALIATNSGTKSNLIDAMQTLQSEQSTLAADAGWLAEAVAGLKIIEADANKTREMFISDNAQKLADAERQLDVLSQRLVKLRAQLDHMTLRSPASGIVQALTVTTLGQVVTTGQDLMRIVPDDVPIEIEAYVDNKDIGFVRPGQEAIIKVESLPFTRYGTIAGRVTHVAKDSVPRADATEGEGDPTRAPNVSSRETGMEKTQNLVFPVTVEPGATQIMADGYPVALSPGMTVSVEVKTGSRRLIEFVFSPLVEVASQAMRER